jgi:hypothetical protein
MHPDIKAMQGEVTLLQRGHPAAMVKLIYGSLPQGPYLRGYKSPSDAEDERAIRMLSTHFPHTKLLIGLRHPIHWFESFYNFRIQNGRDMPPAEQIQAKCFRSQQGVCLDRANFHVHLAKLQKTNVTTSSSSEQELRLFTTKQKKALRMLNNTTRKSANRIFLYDTEQLGDTMNASRQLQFRQDLASYLGLTSALPPILHISPGKKLNNATEQAKRDANKINICDNVYEPQRKKLLDRGRRIRDWLRQYFLKSPDVVVSNPKHFDAILATYAVDPCFNLEKVDDLQKRNGKGLR